MDYVIFDLEWNGCFCQKLGCNINEIIEIGAVKLDNDLKELNRFSMLIRPEISKRISNPVKNLTSITFEELQNGVPFDYAYSKFGKFCKDCILMTWSMSDIDVLIWNIRYHFGSDRIEFMKMYADLQQYCHDVMNVSESNALGLQNAAEYLDIDTFSIPQHRALDDSLLSAMCLRKIYRKEQLESYIKDVDDVFYEKLFFKPYIITDIENADIDLSKISFDCEVCLCRAVRKNEWHEQFKSFTADFECPVCKRKFKGRIQFKQKYDRVDVSKKILTDKKKSSES